MSKLPGWAEWNAEGAGSPWTVGIEEEVMLLDPRDWSLASRIDEVLPALPAAVAERAAAETHGSALELASLPHPTVAGAVDELASLRAALAARLARARAARGRRGTHPFAQWSEVEVSPGARYRSIYDSMRELARREPTFALHVHVAVPDAESAVCALRGLRVHVPLLLALAANSPFWQGRDTGLASARVPIFGTFPRVGIPRRFAGYAEYVEAIDVLLRCDAFPEPTFLWWDVRLQPKLGTIEVRIMDAQTRVRDNASLAALVQCAVRLEATEATSTRRSRHGPRCWTRTASSRCATGCGRGSSTPSTTPSGRCATSSTSSSPPAARTPRSWTARPSSPPSRSWRPSPATTGSGCSSARRRATRSDRGSGCS